MPLQFLVVSVLRVLISYGRAHRLRSRIWWSAIVLHPKVNGKLFFKKKTIALMYFELKIE